MSDNFSLYVAISCLEGITHAFPSVYETFNYVESASWVIIAIVLPFWFRHCPGRKRPVIFRASFTLVLFGISDYLEAPRHGNIPPWLWAWKILCGAYLLWCRYDYLGKEHFRWRDRTNVLALVCFFTVLLVMFLQFHFRDLLTE